MLMKRFWIGGFAFAVTLAAISAQGAQDKKDDEASVYLEHMLDTIPDEGDCEKANIYIISAKAAISRNTNLSNLSEKLSEIERRCLRQ